jgi:hypothetical protein
VAVSAQEKYGGGRDGEDRRSHVSDRLGLINRLSVSANETCFAVGDSHADQNEECRDTQGLMDGAQVTVR